MSSLRAAREACGLGREHVSRLLDPPISAKTLERWEAGSRVKQWRLGQLADVYGMDVAKLLNGNIVREERERAT